MDKREATERWVREDMSYIPTRMIRDMIAVGIGDFNDITPYGDESEVPCDYDYGLPMWGVMFQFKSGLDDDWLENNVDTMCKCGFNVWDSDYGLFFGIDGAGYDFYESHWMPLYDARGLRWHDES